MSFNSALGQGMIEVAGNAMLAQAIADQASEIAAAHHSLDAMTQYATKLEGNVKYLHGIIVRHGALIDKLSKSLNEVAEERDQLALKNAQQEARIARIKADSSEWYQEFNRQLNYARDLKERLAQTEKALKHSSRNSVGLENLQAYLIEVTAALDNADGISEKAKEILEAAYDQFMESGMLTPDAEMQKVLDELKIKAPDLKPGINN